MTTPKELKQEQNKREEKKKSTSRSTEAIKSSKRNFLVELRSPKGSQETPKRPSRYPKGLPRGPQEHQKRPQESPKTLSGSSSDIKR